MYQIGKNMMDNEKNFNKKYEKTYERHKEIFKKHHLLRHAFNVTDYVRLKNNEIDQNEYLEENRKEKYKFNILNFENNLKSNKGKKLYSLDDELLKILLSKINKKNNEEQLKKKEEKIIFQSLSLKGIRTKINIKNNCNKATKSFNAYDTYNNSSKINFKLSSNKYRNILYKNNINDFHLEKYESPIKFYYNNLDNQLKTVIQSINSNEKNNLTNFNSMKTYFNNKLEKSRKDKLRNKTLYTEKIKRPRIIIKNVQKIKRKKDLEDILFKDYDYTFNKVRKKLYTLYQFPKKYKIHND